MTAVHAWKTRREVSFVLYESILSPLPATVTDPTLSSYKLDWNGVKSRQTLHKHINKLALLTNNKAGCKGRLGRTLCLIFSSLQTSFWTQEWSEAAHNILLNPWLNLTRPEITEGRGQTFSHLHVWVKWRLWLCCLMYLCAALYRLPCKNNKVSI